MTDATSMRLRMQAKQQEVEARRLMKESQKERSKAKAALKKGNRPAANLYAQNAVRYEQQANKLLQNSAASVGMMTDVQAAETSAQMARAMGVTTSQMGKISNQINMDKVSADRGKMDELKDRMSTAHELLTHGNDALELEAATSDALAALEDEIYAENEVAMEEPPMSIPQAGVAQGNATRARI